MVRIFFFRTLSCNDGWPSPSIGLQGACSHHGGVEDGISITSIFISLAVIFFIHRKIKNKNSREKMILQKKSLKFFSTINYFFCTIWNALMIFLKIIKLQKIFNNSPYILGIFFYIICFIFPALFLIFIPLTFTAFYNNADQKNFFLIPKK